MLWRRVNNELVAVNNNFYLDRNSKFVCV